MRETKVEAHLYKQVRKAGGRCIKLIPVDSGIPDRMVILPGGRIFLVELKAPGGSTRPIQKVWHARIAKLGVHVPLLSSKEEVDAWLEEQEGPFCHHGVRLVSRVGGPNNYCAKCEKEGT
jgi:hypothetical protein